MSTTNLISSMRFLSLATAALVTGPAATYAAMDPPAPKRDPSLAENGGSEWQRRAPMSAAVSLRCKELPATNRRSTCLMSR
jgi:hypothetical protein